MGLDSGSQPRQFVDEEEVQACLARLCKGVEGPLVLSSQASLTIC